MLDRRSGKKDEILKEFWKLLPNFDHKERGKYLDEKM